MSEKKRRTKSRGNGTGCAYYSAKYRYWVAQAVVDWRVIAEDKPLVPVKRTKGGFKTRDQALQYCPILKAGGMKEDKAPTLSHYWNLYEKDELTTVGPSKQRAYNTAWNRLKPLHESRVSSITVSDLRRVVSDSADTYYTAKDCKILLSNLFRMAAADGYANKDLPSFIILPKLEEHERQVFTDLEQAALWKTYESGDLRVAPILLMIYSGMMPGELIGLHVDQIDLQKRLITGAGMKTAVRKKTPIVLAENIVPVVQDLINHAQPDGRLFKTNDLKRWREGYYYPALKAAGCRQLPPYSCRHTCATALAITEGIAPQTVQKVMRWSSSRMLDRYAHPDQEAALEAVDMIKKQTAK